MKIFCPALCLLCTCTAYAAPPEANITGPTSAVPGDIILLDASTSTATFFNWVVNVEQVAVPDGGSTAQLEKLAEAIRLAGGKVTFPTTSEKPTHLILGDGKQLLLSSYPGTYKVNLAVGNAEGVAQLPWTLVVEGKGPQPPPPPPVPPVPPPVPPTPPPPTPTNLTERVAAAVARIGVTRIEDEMEFLLLASAYSKTVPAEIESGKLKTVEATYARVADLTKLYMVNNYWHWKGNEHIPGIVRIVEQHFDDHVRPMTGDPPSKLVPTFKEVAAGIKQGLGVTE